MRELSCFRFSDQIVLLLQKSLTVGPRATIQHAVRKPDTLQVLEGYLEQRTAVRVTLREAQLQWKIEGGTQGQAGLRIGEEKPYLSSAHWARDGILIVIPNPGDWNLLRGKGFFFFPPVPRVLDNSELNLFDNPEFLLKEKSI